MRRAYSGVVLAAAVAVAGAAAVHGERFARQISRPHWEDFRFFRHNRAHVPTAASCLTSPPAWPGLYRPLSTSCYYYAGRTLFGNRLEVYHAINAALYTANGVLLFVIAGTVLPGRWPLLATALFVTRRAHAPLLVTTSEAQALTAAFFALAAVACTLRPGPRGWGRWAAPLLFLAALLCKETVVVAPLIVAAHWRLFAPTGEGRSRLATFLGFVAAGAAWAALFAAAQSRGGWEPTGFTYDVSAMAAPRLAAYLLSFVNPLASGPAQVEMPPAVLDRAFSPAAIGLTVALVTAAGAVLAWPDRLARSAEARAAVFGIAWFVAGALPFLFFSDRLFMRYGYLAHAGLAIAAAASVAAVARAVSAARGRARRATVQPAAP